MSGAAERSAEWIYRGIWLVLVEWFRVPRMPPTLPVEDASSLNVFHPSRRYLAYLKVYFWVGLIAIDVALLAGWFLVWWHFRSVGLMLLVPVLLLAVVPDILAYIAIHLRYDTLWYALSDRGIHVRRGIVVITEHTITFENVQNVLVHQGPIEQLFGIASLIIETAGASAGEGEDVFSVGNQTIMVGLDNPETIRNRVLEHVRASASAGLGDDTDRNPGLGWTGKEIELLAEIRDEVRQLAATEA